eukprot:COSAG01_NODE_5193_length_4419_cov_606.935591_1_plen_1138_part_10
MQLKSIFYKPVDRPIEGVIKADDRSSLYLEVEEYELTNEIEKRLESFLESYNDYETANGVWISGFFGSGKSHLLKMISLLLANKAIDDQDVLESFLEKCPGNNFLQGSLRKAVSIPSESILFNIDQKADVINKTQVDALLSVFVKVFDEHCGYYGKQPFIAQFERQLDEDGLIEQFKQAFQKHEANGKDWEWGRTRITRVSEVVDKAYSEVSGNQTNEVINRYRSDYKLSIEDFANQVKKYIKARGKDFRLNFFVDEAGQYIADNIKLMTNLQTVAESLNTKCNGQAWVMVTAQEDMNTVIGEMDKQQANDFSKIQDRFSIRMKLTSADVAEVIQKRLLKKTDDGCQALLPVYEREQNNFRTLFDFTGGSQTYKNFTDADDFVRSYPFIPYQFELFQLAIKNLSDQNAFEGKHSSVGERSMLGVFQDVAVKISDHGIGDLATFDLMFEGISAALKGQIQSSIGLAERNLENPLAIRVLKALFLVKYVREFKATLRNLSILMIERFDQDMNQLHNDIETALNLLESQVYIQRNGDTYEFLTDEEKDVEQEIKNTEVDSTDISAELNKIIFDTVLKARKMRYDGNKQDFNFSRKLDDRISGREYELAVHVISPYHEHAGSFDQLKMAYMGNAELLIAMPAEDRLIRDLTLYMQTKKYVAQNISLTQKEAVKRILTSKQLSNQERQNDLVESVRNQLSKSRMFVSGSEIESNSADPNSRIADGFSRLVVNTYPNLAMIKINYGESDIDQCLQDSDDGLFGNDATAITEAENNVLSFINRNAQKSIRTSIKALVENFEKKPNGWPLIAIQCTLAKLIARGKVEARSDSELLDGKKLLTSIKNTSQHGNVLLDPQIEFSASQVRRLKEFFEQFFDGPPNNSDAKTLGVETADRFKELESTLSGLMSHIEIFPFLNRLEEGVAKIKSFGMKSFKYFLTEFESESENLLDLKEDLLDPIRKFMGDNANGPQAAVYKEARQFLQKNETNLKYIDNDDAGKIRDILDDPNCYSGNGIRDAKTLLEELKKKVETERKNAQEEAANTIREKSQKIIQFDGFEQLPDEKKTAIESKINEAVEYVKQQPLIAVVRESVNQFNDETYNKILQQIESDHNQEKTDPATGDSRAPVPVKQSVQLSSLAPAVNKP